MGNLPLCISKQEGVLVGECGRPRSPSILPFQLRSVSESPGPLESSAVFSVVGGRGRMGVLEEEEEQDEEEREGKELEEGASRVCFSVGVGERGKEEEEEDKVRRVLGRDAILGSELQNKVAVSLCNVYVRMWQTLWPQQ